MYKDVDYNKSIKLRKYATLLQDFVIVKHQKKALQILTYMFGYFTRSMRPDTFLHI